ncbi:hypothetical protein WG66_009745 [Moniliophthora roreri]|nr:hypothetical protein WG66_009745 [Moniliophthora roreri]
MFLNTSRARTASVPGHRDFTTGTTITQANTYSGCKVPLYVGLYAATDVSVGPYPTTPRRSDGLFDVRWNDTVTDLMAIDIGRIAAHNPKDEAACGKGGTEGLSRRKGGENERGSGSEKMNTNGADQK